MPACNWPICRQACNSADVAVAKPSTPPAIKSKRTYIDALPNLITSSTHLSRFGMLKALQVCYTLQHGPVTWHPWVHMKPEVFAAPPRPNPIRHEKRPPIGFNYLGMMGTAQHLEEPDRGQPPCLRRVCGLIQNR